MRAVRLGLTLVAAFLSASCSAVLGFEDAVLGPEEGGGGGVGGAQGGGAIAGSGGLASGAPIAGSGGTATLAGGGGSGGSLGGQSGTGGFGFGGMPACTTPNEHRCAGPASTEVLTCDATAGVYVFLANCAPGERCDSRDATCKAIVPGCGTADPGDLVCYGATLRICGPDLVTSTDTDCMSPALCTFHQGTQCAVCRPNEHRCDGAELERCEPDHLGFMTVATCTSADACDVAAGQCVACHDDGDCAVPADPCKDVGCDHAKCTESLVGPGTPSRMQTDHDCVTLVCDVSGNAVPLPDDDDLPIASGPCQIAACNGGMASLANADPGTPCGTGMVCNEGGTCVECLEEGATDCLGSTPRTCVAGTWTTGTACTGRSSMCQQGSCVVPPPSCATTGQVCGPLDESCCVSYEVPGATFSMGSPDADPDALDDEKPEHDATVSTFRLDAYEVTVARFRAFVEAYPGDKPAADAGAHPLIAGSGWQSGWDASLPADATALTNAVSSCSGSPWTTDAGADEGQPMTCVSWYEAFAFCAWDGGRLPTEAERELAAKGGVDDRRFPTGDAPPPPSVGCSTVAGCLPAPGSTPGDVGRFGHFDLAGSVSEHAFDWYDSAWYKGSGMTCDDCADLSAPEGTPLRVRRGGTSRASEPVAQKRSAARFTLSPAARDVWTGIRCAR